MTTGTVAVSYGTPEGAGDLGQPWIFPHSAAAPDGDLAVSSVDADALIADTVTDLLARNTSFGPIPSGARLASLAITVRAMSVGSKGTAALTLVRFRAGPYDSGNLVTPITLSTTAQDYSFDLAHAPAIPSAAALAAGGQWSVRFAAVSGSCAVAVDAVAGPAFALVRLRPRGLLSRNYRSRNFRAR